MSNANPASGSGRRDSSGKYNKRRGYVSKSEQRRMRSQWISRRARESDQGK